ncbi:hypothetical protein EMIHUDRAFT_310632 [Emiliania huxleyi CCMP1516]|uniref:Uncharacterized protein n=2 Tax=Emiliania huxleyi TaxID=2903 RepID=A0A0D3J9B5_EMIH1|nr:hypothetical protein EMIHUDRAFT_310632 [Emiliania huxleyi CCMP1516]EOD20100.1 hypothetical protein EMIHUDRAFT_310632 [Emiliania huxleyi CCMP1516]|eukprot:XP_005772529.1 hypothetical protein EMIHUDRAFT_310632 [Emiliania huxleyi CCMP1516]
MLPAKLRAWAKCGAWRAPQRACPPCWLGRSPPVPRLDLSFVTHLFLVNPIDDEARLAQVVARAHRMGATAPVLVEPMLLWDD